MKSSKKIERYKMMKLTERKKERKEERKNIWDWGIGKRGNMKGRICLNEKGKEERK